MLTSLMTIAQKILDLTVSRFITRQGMLIQSKVEFEE